MKQGVLRKLVSVALLLIFAGLFSVMTDSFLTWRNINSILREVSVVGLLSLGVSFVIISGGIDLSTGSVLGVSAMITSKLVTETLLPIWLIIVLVLAAGLILGLVNGLLVTKLGLSELIASFATMYVYRGFVYLLAYHDDGGHLITKAVQDTQFLSIGGNLNGIYYMSIIWVLLILFGYLILKSTTLGTYMYAVGTNPKSALMSGINVKKVKLLTFAFSGFCSALAGIFLLAWQGSAGLNTGNGMEFQAIAAVAVGGIVLSGGRGDTLGVGIGSLFMIVVVNGIYKFGFPTEIQTIAYGAVIIIMSVFDAVYIRLMERRQVTVKKAPVLAAREGAL